MWLYFFTGLVTGLLSYLWWIGLNIGPVVLLLVLVGVAATMAYNKGLISLEALQKPKTAKESTMTFDQIGGQEAACNELKEALDFLENLEEMEKLGIRSLRGILLVGPPGTGKTLLAKAAATFTDSVFLSASGSEFVEMYAGVGAQRVRKIFAKARKDAKAQNKKSAIIFIDEIEVIGGKRGRVSNQVEYDQTLNQLLVEMDGVKKDKCNILVIGATNRADILDDALMRPGRFDRQVRVDLPDKKGRLAILEIHTRNKPLGPDVNLEEIAKETFGFSGALLESLTNEAAIYAHRDKDTSIMDRHIRAAIEKVLLGEKNDRTMSLEEKRRVAIHELGHAFIAESRIPGSIASITVVPRGSAMGYIRQKPTKDKYIKTADEIKDQIAIALAGAEAEAIFLGNKSSGSAQDYQQANKLAKELVYMGLSDLGIVDPELLSNEELHQAIKRILNEEMSAVRTLIEEYSQDFESLTQVLLDEEALKGEYLREYLKSTVRGRIA